MVHLIYLKYKIIKSLNFVRQILTNLIYFLLLRALKWCSFVKLEEKINIEILQHFAEDKVFSLHMYSTAWGCGNFGFNSETSY